MLYPVLWNIFIFQVIQNVGTGMPLMLQTNVVFRVCISSDSRGIYESVGLDLTTGIGLGIG